MNRRLQENWMFALGVLLVVASAIWMKTAENWSDGMEKRAGLGFHHGLDSPLLAVELAGTEAEFRQVFGMSSAKDSTPAAQDVMSLRGVFKRDFLFLAAYATALSAIVLRLQSLGAIPHPGWVCALITGIVLLALLDVMENLLSLRELGENALVFDPWVKWASVAKWAVSFVNGTLIGSFILLTLRRAESTVPGRLGGMWSLCALLLAGGGVFGLMGCLGAFRPAESTGLMLISPGFQMLGLATLPAIMAWTWREE